VRDNRAMKSRVLALGAGFGGLELATTLSESLSDNKRGDAASPG
jgi:NADH dehydrogenase FAD-containing subunit